ncbi:MAG: hypothetical protein ACYTGL_27660 [Planctomycetota bacterium]|jgi:hypothetical protein
MTLLCRRWLAALSVGALAAAAPQTLTAAEPVPTASIQQVAGEVESHQDELQALVNEAISITSRRYLTADVHTPWQIMHGILALRSEFVIKIDGEKRPAIEWLTSGTTYNSLPVVERTQWGARFHPFTVPYAFEGHPNQFLAILTMSEYPENFTFRTQAGDEVTIEDMVRNAQMTVNDREEITWTLWALSRYLSPEAQWVSAEGEAWSMERLVQIQTYANVNDAACGGTHGLFALSLARNSYMATGKPLRGIWLEADQKIKRYVQMARSLQNYDGSLSSEHFRGPGLSNDFGQRIATTGHVLEFLMVGASQDDLGSEWLRNAVRATARDLVDNRKAAADCGPLYHALHALVLYRQRLQFEPVDTIAVKEQFAKQAAEPKRLDETGTAKPAADAAEDATTEVPVIEETQTVAKPVQPVQPDPPVAAIRKPQPEADVVDTPAEPPMPEQVRKTDKQEGSDAAVEEATTDNIVADENKELQTLTDVLTGIDLGDAAPKAAAETYRSPEDNAYQVPSVPQVMEDGYEIPLPPTED